MNSAGATYKTSNISKVTNRHHKGTPFVKDNTENVKEFVSHVIVSISYLLNVLKPSSNFSLLKTNDTTTTFQFVMVPEPKLLRVLTLGPEQSDGTFSLTAV